MCTTQTYVLFMGRQGAVPFLQKEFLMANSKSYIEGFRIVSESPTWRIYDAVKKIPKGRVATYSQVAAMAGNPKMCRTVGNALHKNPNPNNIPCFRVVNSKGCLSGAFAFGGAGEQARLLMADGIEVENGRVDLKKYGIRLPLECENN